MQTTMAMLYDGLSKRVPCEKGGEYAPDTVVSSVCSCSQSRESDFSKSIVITHALHSCEACHQLPVGNLSRVVQLSPPGIESAHTSAINVCADMSYKDLRRIIEDVLRDYRIWFNKLSTAAFSGAPLDELVQIAHTLLKNPISLQDRALRVRACTVDDVMEDELWEPIKSAGYSYDNTPQFPGLSEFYDELERSRLIRDVKIFNGNVMSACRTKKIDGDFVYLCLIQKHRPISDGDIQLLQFLCTMIEMVIKASDEFTEAGIGYRGLLIDALENRLGGFSELENRMHAVGNDLKAEVHLLVAAPEKGRLTDRQAYRLINDVQNTFSFGKGIFYKGRLVFLSSFNSGEGPTASDYRRFELFCAKSTLLAGVGELHLASGMIHEAYETALVSLNIGRKMFEGKSLFFFGDCRPFYLYEMCRTMGKSLLYEHPAIPILTEHDASRGTNLLEVLTCLVTNWGNRTKTASELFVQRNTLQARIKEIEMLVDVDLDDSVQISHIRNSIFLNRYCNGD